MKRRYVTFNLIMLIFGAATMATADPVLYTDSDANYATLLAGLNDLIDFDNGGVHVNLDGPVSFTGTNLGIVNFAERFAGQTRNDTDTTHPLSGNPFDFLSGDGCAVISPACLALVNGDANQNLGRWQNSLAGISKNGFPAGPNPPNDDTGGVGEGSIAMLFTEDQSRIAFDILGSEDNGLGSDGSFVYIRFYRRDGSLIGDEIAVDLSVGANKLLFDNNNVSEIAGFSIHNDDLDGVLLDNLRFTSTTATVPEPATFVLLGFALAGLAHVRSRKKN
jgi:hypothetical protein